MGEFHDAIDEPFAADYAFKKLASGRQIWRTTIGRSKACDTGLHDCFSQCLGIPEEKSLADLPIKHLDPNFDSLSLIEIQLLLEKYYHFEFQHESQIYRPRLDSTVSDLARQAIESMSQF